MTNCAQTVEVLIEKQLFRIVAQQPTAPRNEYAVLFVHGFFGDAQDTWKSSEEDESFPSLLATDPAVSDYDIFIFQYVTKNYKVPAIANIAGQLEFAVRQHLPHERIILVAHSMGGLVCMTFILNRLKSGNGQSIGGLLFYGVPMTGVEWAKYAQIVLQLATIKIPILSLINKLLKSNKQVEALTAGSEFVDKLNGEWILHVLNGGNPRRPTDQRAWFPVRVVTGNDDWVVKESSARGSYSEIDWINVDTDHRALVKPRSRSEGTYQIAREFLKICRESIGPKPLTKLRRQLDDMMELHRSRYIADWRFVLDFQRNDCVEPVTGFGLSDFRAFNVEECSYRFPLGQNFVKFGIAVGTIAAESTWDDQFAFLHTVRFGGLSTDMADSIIQRLKEVISWGETGWSRLFDKITLRVRHPRSDRWYPLTLGELEQSNDRMIRKFLLPFEALHLVGKEVLINLSFRGLLPSAITDYTVSFPVLCDGFTVVVTVEGKPAYLVDSKAMRGLPKLEVKREQQGKMEYSSRDLILPGSQIRFEWDFEAEGAR